MKTIKLTNFEISNIVESLDKNPDSIINTDDSTKKLPISVLWNIDENMEKLRKINDKILAKRQSIEGEYADDDHSEDVEENGQAFRKVKKEYEFEFTSKIRELLSIQNEIQITPINIDKLEGYDLIPRDFRQIRFMLESEKEEESDDAISIEKVEGEVE